MLGKNLCLDIWVLGCDHLRKRMRNFLFYSLSPTQALSMAAKDFLNARPTIDELCEHVRIAAKWYSFGVLLKLDTIKLDDIKRNYQESDMRALKMFDLWLRTNPNATRKEVIETLRKDAIGELTIANEYEKALKTQSKCNTSIEYI